MTTLRENNDLLNKAASFNRALEDSYLSLAVVLVDIEESEAYKETGYETFADYYKQELGREKSTVSRLMTCGRWLKAHKLGLHGATFSYRQLASAIKTFPDKEPEYVLSVAKTWRDDDFRAEEKEECLHTKPSITVCPDCWKQV